LPALIRLNLRAHSHVAKGINMAGRQAKILNPQLLKRMLRLTARSATPERDRVIVLFSVLAGLRACEIAGAEWSMVLDVRGHVSRVLELPDRVAKKGSGRRIPLHPDLRGALSDLRRMAPSSGPIIRSKRGGSLRPNSIVNWFVALFHELGADGCSSHSGRRTFITQAARQAHRAGATLRDVQMLAGHKSIEVTAA